MCDHQSPANVISLQWKSHQFSVEKQSSVFSGKVISFQWNHSISVEHSSVFSGKIFIFYWRTGKESSLSIEEIFIFDMKTHPRDKSSAKIIRHMSMQIVIFQGKFSIISAFSIETPNKRMKSGAIKNNNVCQRYRLFLDFKLWWGLHGMRLLVHFLEPECVRGPRPRPERGHVVPSRVLLGARAAVPGNDADHQPRVLRSKRVRV